MLISAEKLKELAGSVGISEIGIAAAEPLIYMQSRLQRRIDEGRLTGFEEKNPSLRLSAEHLLAGCRSIITLAAPYAAASETRTAAGEEPRGLVARCARGIDYHYLVESKAAAIVSLIKKETGSDPAYRILTDRSPLLERELAYKSGLGLIGENCTLINPRYGSYTSLGTILIKADLPPEKPESQVCSTCGECRKACPTGALSEPYIINPFRCLSYLTQASGIFPREMRPFLGARIYGCDLCQEVCPQNKTAQCSLLPETAFSFFPARPLLIPILKMTQKEFDMTVGLTSAGWRGKTTLQRNAVIALGNSGSPAAVSMLARLLENDPRPLIRLHSAWALGATGGARSKLCLEKSYMNDPVSQVREESARALEEAT
jgi:epoxyqueuosine reductase